MNSRPKVLLLSPIVPYPPTDGGKLRTFNLCNLLAQDYDITILAKARYDDLGYEKYLSDEFFSKIRFIPVVYPDNTALAETKKPPIIKMIKNKIREWTDIYEDIPYGLDFTVDPKFHVTLEECLRQQRFDIVHAEHLHMSQYLKYAQDIPTVLTEMDVEYEKVRRSIQSLKAAIKGKWITQQADKLIKPIKLKYQLENIKSIESSLAKTVDICIAMSEYDKKTLQTMNPGLRIEVVPNGVDVSYFQPFECRNLGPTITYTGHMGYLPNIDAVQYFYKDIYPKIRSVFPDVKLNVVGKSPDEQIRALGDSDLSVTVTGFVDDVRPYMGRDCIYIAPLRLGSGTRLKILEAMAMKMAVVSTSIGCEGLDVEDSKNILIANTPEDFAGKVMQLLRNPELKYQLGENARALVEEKYDWSKIAKIQDALYQELINK